MTDLKQQHFLKDNSGMQKKPETWQLCLNALKYIDNYWLKCTLMTLYFFDRTKISLCYKYCNQQTPWNSFDYKRHSQNALTAINVLTRNLSSLGWSNLNDNNNVDDNNKLDTCSTHGV